MYGLKDIRRGISQPYLILREINRLYSQRFGLRNGFPDGVDIFEEDWDNLIILDACRYDVFEDAVDLPGNLEKRKSRGTATPEFIQNNFSDRELHDTVYITGNSWYLKLKDDINSEVYRIYDVTDNSDRNKIDRLTQCAKDCVDRHPNKRLIIHYIPPHHPYVGTTADKHFPPYDDQLDDFFNRIQRGDIDITDEMLSEAYYENLERVIPKVEELISVFQGKTVVTGDHGEMLGENSKPIPISTYGHPSGLYVDELLTIPWNIVDNSGRKEIIAEEPGNEIDTSYSSTDKTIDERLQDLGYKV